MVNLKSKLGSFFGKSLKVQSGHVEAFLGIKYGKYEPFNPPEIVSSYSSEIDASKPAPFFPQNLVPVINSQLMVLVYQLSDPIYGHIFAMEKIPYSWIQGTRAL